MHFQSSTPTPDRLHRQPGRIADVYVQAARMGAEGAGRAGSAGADLTFATTGYMLDTMNGVRTNQTPPLPDWSENIGILQRRLMLVSSLSTAWPRCCGLLGSGHRRHERLADNADAVGWGWGWVSS